MEEAEPYFPEVLHGIDAIHEYLKHLGFKITKETAKAWVYRFGFFPTIDLVGKSTVYRDDIDRTLKQSKKPARRPLSDGRNKRSAPIPLKVVGAKG